MLFFRNCGWKALSQKRQSHFSFIQEGMPPLMLTAMYLCIIKQVEEWATNDIYESL